MRRSETKIDITRGDSRFVVAVTAPERRGAWIVDWSVTNGPMHDGGRYQCATRNAAAARAIQIAVQVARSPTFGLTTAEIVEAFNAHRTPVPA